MSITIPKHMDNEESKMVAEIVVLEREQAIASAKLFAAHNRYNKYKLEKSYK